MPRGDRGPRASEDRKWGIVLEQRGQHPCLLTQCWAEGGGLALRATEQPALWILPSCLSTQEGRGYLK